MSARFYYEALLLKLFEIRAYGAPVSCQIFGGVPVAHKHLAVIVTVVLAFQRPIECSRPQTKRPVGLGVVYPMVQHQKLCRLTFLEVLTHASALRISPAGHKAPAKGGAARGDEAPSRAGSGRSGPESS